LPMKVRQILTNPFYIGYINAKVNGTMVYRKGSHEPIIDEESFFSVNNKDDFDQILTLSKKILDNAGDGLVERGVIKNGDV